MDSSSSPSLGVALWETVNVAFAGSFGAGVFGASSSTTPAELFELVKGQRFPEALRELQDRPRLWAARDGGSRSLLHWASLAGSIDVIQSALAARVPVDEVDIDRRTPMMWAVCHGHVSAAQLLLNAAADPSAADAKGATPLILAVQEQQYEAAEWLVAVVGEALLTGRDASGCGAVHWAAFGGDLRALELLVKLRADLHARDRSGMVPLHRAALAHHADAVEFLLARRADLAVRDAVGDDVVDVVIHQGDAHMQSGLLIAFLMRLAENHADVSLNTCGTSTGASDLWNALQHAVATTPVGIGAVASWASAWPTSHEPSVSASERNSTAEQAGSTMTWIGHSWVVEDAGSWDKLHQMLLQRLVTSGALAQSDSMTSLLVTDRLGANVDVLSLSPARLPAQDCFPLRMHIVTRRDCLCCGEVPPSLSAVLDSACSQRMRAHAGFFGGSLLSGVPAQFRWELWKQALRARGHEPPAASKYRELCGQHNEWTSLIAADVARLVEGRAQSEGHTEPLVRILSAYACHRPRVGYAQGMHVVAGLLLLASGGEEAECFGVLACLMDNLGLAQLFCEGFPLLRSCDGLAAEQAPRLQAHLVEEGAEGVMYFLGPWLLTLLVDCLPSPMALRVLDDAVCHGPPVLLRVALSLLHHLEPVLLPLSLEAMARALQALRRRSARPAGEELAALSSATRLLLHLARSVHLPPEVVAFG